MLLEKYIREVLIISERNQPKLLKKSIDGDLLIANITSESLSNIYLEFQSPDLVDSFVKCDADRSNSLNNAKSIEEKVNTIKRSRFSIIELLKNDKVIAHLKDNHNFNFSNCNVEDNKPIFCIPANALMGDNTASINRGNLNKKQSKLIKNQSIEDPEDWNWAAHDLHHGEISINTDGKKFLDTAKISTTGLEKTSSDKTRYEYMDRYFSGINRLKSSSAPLGRRILRKKKEEIKDFWLIVIGFYFNKIGFTKGVSRLDIWASIYSYCLTKMSSSEDAYNIDFRVINEKDKMVLVDEKGNKQLQDFFANAYLTVRKNSLLNNLKDNRIYIANMF